MSSEIAPKFRGVPATDILALSEKPLNFRLVDGIPDIQNLKLFANFSKKQARFVYTIGAF